MYLTIGTDLSFIFIMVNLKEVYYDIVTIIILTVFSSRFIYLSFVASLFYLFLDPSEVIIKLYIFYNVINQVISYWTSYRSEVSCIGPRPEAEVQYS